MGEFSAFDVNERLHPQQFRAASRRVVNMAHQSPNEVVERGMNWYPAVHDATSKGARDLGVSHRQASGIVAAVSPNMDWEKNNISALQEIGSLRGEHWNMIQRSASEGKKRNPEVGHMLREVAPSLSPATDENLLKAHRLLQGHDVDEVLSRRGAPKTHSFAHNIHSPESWEHVTIDGRQADIIANQMRPWQWSGRGISSAALPSGKPTRYEDHEQVMRTATRVLQRRDARFKDASPSAVQAVTWEMGKIIERQGTTKTGEPRKKGVARQGQPYF